MKHTQLKQLIKEEIHSVLGEGLFDRFKKKPTPPRDIFDVLEDYTADKLSFQGISALADEYKEDLEGESSDRLMQADWTRKNIDKSKAEEMVKKIKAGLYDY